MVTSETITLSMIVKNEEKYLRECLNSVKDLVSEIVLVDTGSTDKTINIAKEYNAKIFNFEWVNDFSAARNYALSKSTGNWILYLDADERLSKDSVNRIKRLVANEKDSLLGVKCLVNSIDDIHGKPKLMKYVRLFRNTNDIRFAGRVHEQIEDSLNTNRYRIVNSDIEIIHVGYNIETQGLKEKAKRNLGLLLKEYENNCSSYYAFHLGNTFLILEELVNAINYFNIALEKDDLGKAYKAICYLHIADYFNSDLHDYEKAESAVLKGLMVEPSNPLLNLLASQICDKAGKKDKAIIYCKDSLIHNKALKSKNENSSIFYIVLESEKIYTYGLFLSYKYQSNEAFSYFFKEADPIYQKVIPILLNKIQWSSAEIKIISNFINKNNLELALALLENSKDRASALKILQSVKTNFEENSKFLITLGNMLIENKYFNDGVNAFKESLKLKSKDPSAVFYLISALVGQNRLSEIPEWLLFAEKEFGHIPVFNEKFSILKQKLEALIK